MQASDKQLSAEQSRQVAETVREEIARRRISRQSLAEQAASARRPRAAEHSRKHDRHPNVVMQ